MIEQESWQKREGISNCPECGIGQPQYVDFNYPGPSDREHHWVGCSLNRGGLKKKIEQQKFESMRL